MPLVKIHVVKGRYDQARIAKVSSAIQSALISTLRVPPEDFYQLIFELPKNRFLHTPAFVGVHYTGALIIRDPPVILVRPAEMRLGCLETANTPIATAGTQAAIGTNTIYARSAYDTASGPGALLI